MKHRALGDVKLPCGRWPHFIDRKNMIYCERCLKENTIDQLAPARPVEKDVVPPQDLEVPEVWGCI